MAKDREMGNLTVRLRADITQYLAMMDKAGDTTTKTTSKIEAAAAKMGTAFASVTAGIAAFATMAIKSAVDWGKSVDDLSDKTGMAGEDASKLLVIMKRAGVDADTAQSMMAKFGKSIYTAADAMAKAAADGKESDDVLTKLGIAAVNLDGSMRPTLDIFNDVRARLSQMEDGWQKTALEMQLFGKSGAEMHDVLHMTTQEMQAAIDKAQKLGLILSTEQAQAWEQFDRNVNSVKGSLTSLGVGIGNDFLPVLEKQLDRIQAIAGAFAAWRDKNPALAKSLEEVAASLGLIVLEAKALAMVGVRSPWIIGILTTGYLGGKLADLNVASQKAKEEKAGGKYVIVGNHTEWRPTQGGSTIGNQDPESLLFNAGLGGGAFKAEQSKTVDKDADKFLGGGGGSGSKGKTALETFLEAQRNELQIIEKKRELRQITDQEYYSMLQVQRTALVAVTAAADEELKKRVAILDIDIKIMQEDKKRADLSKKLVLQQYADNEKSVNDRLKLHGDVYSKELEMEELRRGSNKKYLTWLLAESKKFNEQKSSMDDYQFMEESQREALRREAIKKTNEEIAKENIRTADASKEAWVDALSGIVTGTRDKADVLKQIWEELVNNIIRSLFGLEAKAGGLLGGIFGNSSGGGNWLSSIFGGLFGGGGGGDIGPQLTYDSSGMFLVPKFADGGLPPTNRLSIVGEAGPELFVPGRAGRIVSNDELGGLGGRGGDIYVQPTFQSLDPAENMRMFKEQLPMIKAEIRNAMVNEPSMRTAVRSAAK